MACAFLSLYAIGKISMPKSVTYHVPTDDETALIVFIFP